MVLALVGEAAGRVHGVATGPKFGDHYRVRSNTAFASYVAGPLAAAYLLAHAIDVQEHHTYASSQKATLEAAYTIPNQLCGVNIIAKMDGSWAKTTWRVKSHVGKSVLGHVGLGSIGGEIDKGFNNTVGKVDIASWSETYHGEIGGIGCTDNSIFTQPKWDPNAPRRDCNRPTIMPAQPNNPNSVLLTSSQKAAPKAKVDKNGKPVPCKTGAYVITVNEAANMTVIPYEVNPGTGWKSDNGGVAAIVNNLNNVINAIPFKWANVNWSDNKYNGLRFAVLTRLFNEFATTCVPLALKKLSNARGLDVSTDALTAQPKTMQGNAIHDLVATYSANLATKYKKLYGDKFYESIKNDPKWMISPDDFNVNFIAPPANVRIPTVYDRFVKPWQALNGKLPKSVSFSKDNKSGFVACTDATDKLGVSRNG